MGLFNFRKPEVREGNDVDLLQSLVTSDSIDAAKAMEIPAVDAVINYIAGTVSSLPVRLYRTENGASIEVEDDYRLKLLNSETGDLLDACQFKSALIKDYILRGNGYAYVNWKGNKIESLNYVEPTVVSRMIGADPIFKRARFEINGQMIDEFKMLRVLRHTVNGIEGKGLIDEKQQFLSAMYSTIQYEKKAVKTGGKRGFIKAERRLEETALNKLKAAWARLNDSAESETVMILNAGLDFKDATTTAVESQLNENKQTNAAQLFRIFGLSAAAMNGTAAENEIRNVIRTAIKPVATELQNAFNRFCLLEKEKDSLEFIIDLDGLDTTSILTRYQAWDMAVKDGWMTLDEVRYEEGLNPLDLNFVKLGLDTVIYDPQTKVMYTPNTKEEYDLNGQPTDEQPSEEGGEEDESAD